MEEERHSTVLKAAIMSGCLVIGLLAGLPLGNLARNFSAALSGKEIALPQQE